jgi:lysozyme
MTIVLEGQGRLAGSTLLRELNAGNYAGAAECFRMWDFVGKTESAGLRHRRAAEAALFLGKMV